MATSVLTPLQLIAGAGLLQNQGISVSPELQAAITAYRATPLMQAFFSTGPSNPTLAANSVLVNGRPIAVFGGKVTPHPCCGQKGCPPVHCNAKTTSTNGTVLAGGKPVVTVGDKDTCSHARQNGSSDVVIG